MPIKGMRNIKTHGTLSREGKLLSVAKDLHRVDRKKINDVGIGAWDGNVARNIFDKKSVKSTKLHSLNMGKLPSFIEDDIREMEVFAAEGLPGAKKELEWLRQRLSRVKARRM